MQNKLDVKALGLAFGILWGVGIFLLGLAAWLLNWGNQWVGLIGSGYIGFNASFAGSIIGGIWAFLDGLIGGALLAWLYNKLA